MTQNTGRAQCARIPDPCNKVEFRVEFMVSSLRHSGEIPAELSQNAAILIFNYS
jgi:hypothetical protein